MIRLTQQEAAPHLVRSLGEARAALGQYPVARVEGEGPWNSFLPRRLKKHMDYLRLTPGCPELLNETDIDALSKEKLLAVKLAITKVRLHHTQVLGSMANNERLACAIIFRPAAYIFFSTISLPDVYVPLPETSGHEVLEDLHKLEAEFPGIFEVSA